MRIKYLVTARDEGWTVGRGRRETYSCRTREQALTLAENLARGTAARGELALVTVVAGGEILEQRRYAPDIF